MAEAPHLQLIGYWAFRWRPSPYPHPKRLVCPGWRPGDRARIVAYLRSGHLHTAYCGPSFCRLCGRANGTREFTDGEWAWPEGLGHYVDAHRVRLPEEVVATMEARGWQVPADPGPWAGAPPDESFWVGWSARLKASKAGLLRRFVDRVLPYASAHARRREVEQDFVFYCQVCGVRRVRLARHEDEALCSAECRHLQDVALSYFEHKSCGVTFSDDEVFEATGLRVSSLPGRMRCKWCGQATLKMTRDAARCARCGGGRDEW